jgi:hypothetical protein
MKDMKNQCKFCAGKFGLVRYYHWRQAFCSKLCLVRFDQEMRGKVMAARERFGLTAAAANARLAHARVAKRG